MSALAQQSRFYSFTPRRISEAELLRVIGHITWTASDEEPALAAVAAAVVQMQGLVAFRFEPFEDLPHLPIYELSTPQSSNTNASALAQVTANGRTYGQIRIFFDPHSLQLLESPVRLTRFIGQQTGILLHRLELQRERKAHISRLETIDRVIRRRKTIHRAAVVLAQQRRISESEGISLMVRYGRQNRQSLLQIAESLIFGFNSAAFRRPYLRRLSAQEPTSNYSSQGL